MKKSVLILVLQLSCIIIISGQIGSSGKVPVLINNISNQNPKQNKTQLTDQNNISVKPGYNADLSILPGKYYALLIGINNYSDPTIKELDYALRDAKKFYQVITSKYTFEAQNVRFIQNATYENIITALDYFAKIVQPSDNFLIFYAGHGYWNATSETGFWLPNDAQKNSTRNWFRNSVLRDFLREIRSKHTLLITDACFGGSIFKTRNAFPDASLAINRLYELPSRKAMTSGNYNEEVPDQSAFLKYLVDRLQNNYEKYLSSEQLFSNFKMAVINNSKVIPQFGVIQDVGDEGGDFIFILR
jgi:hypothetical protein